MANVTPFPMPNNLPPRPTPPSAEGDLHQSAYREGFRSGYLDACLNYTSRYAIVVFGTESEWQRFYSHGYIDGQRAAGYCGRITFKIFRSSITGVEEQMSTSKPTKEEEKA